MTDQHTASNATPDAPGPGTPPGTTGFIAFVVERLAAQSGEIGVAWASRGAAAIVASRPNGAGAPAQAADAEAAGDLVRTLVGAVGGGHRHEEVMRAGWRAGTNAFWTGTTLYQLLKELDGGVTLLFQATDSAARGFQGQATASDGLALARRLSEAASLLRLAAAGGYTRAMSDELRHRYRTIRHDLRNPLGTITNAMAMMDDESLPAETRQNPRVRAMVARNARSLEAMIAATLGDSAAMLPSVAVQATSLMDLACAVRGDLRAASEDVDVIVANDLPHFPLDSTGIELLLKATVLAVARTCGDHAEVAIGLEDRGPRSVTIAVQAVSPRTAETPPIDLAFARDLVTRLGGRAVVGGEQRVLLEIPVQPGPATDRQVERAGGAIPPLGDSSAREQRDDVAGEGERPNGEPRAL